MAGDLLKTVREVAVGIPGATRVLERFGIDYCCGGEATLEEACGRAGISIAELRRSLAEAEEISAKAPASTDWSTQPMSRLTSHIIETHHVFTRTEIDRLEHLLDKVCGVHGENHPELHRINDLVSALKNDLLAHMMKEERVLFPYIDQLDAAAGEGKERPVPFFGTVANPINMMMSEHETAGDILKRIRAASGNFAVPPDGCMSYRTLYTALEAMERDLHEHIHLENNILFPAALALEA
jgi:regulator of cell morphogenesis and NO signaling